MKTFIEYLKEKINLTISKYDIDDIDDDDIGDCRADNSLISHYLEYMAKELIQDKLAIKISNSGEPSFDHPNSIFIGATAGKYHQDLAEKLKYNATGSWDPSAFLENVTRPKSINKELILTSTIEWHSVNDELPNKEEQLLVLIENNTVLLTNPPKRVFQTVSAYPFIYQTDPTYKPHHRKEDLDFTKLAVSFFGEGGKRLENVTHWAYMPKLLEDES